MNTLSFETVIAKIERLQQELPIIETEFQRIEARKFEVERQIEALSLVHSMFSQETEIPRTVVVSTNTHTTSGVNLKGTVRDSFAKLPYEYKKSDIKSLILAELPNVLDVNDNTLTGIASHLVKNGMAIVKSKSTGRSPQVYTKA